MIVLTQQLLSGGYGYGFPSVVINPMNLDEWKLNSFLCGPYAFLDDIIEIISSGEFFISAANSHFFND